LIDHGQTGWLVPEKNSAALKQALLDLITDPGLRASLAQAGLVRVSNYFALDHGIDQLAAKLGVSAKPDITP